LIKFLTGKDGRFRTIRACLIFCTLLGLVYLSATVWISNTYGIPIAFTGKMIGREALLSMVRISTVIYDPATTRKAAISPKSGNPAFGEGYVRIEDLLNTPTGIQSIQLVGLSNEKIIQSGHGFSYQPYDEKRLAALRKEYKLDEVVASARDEFEAMVLLRNWTRSQFRRVDYQFLMRNFDVLQILKGNIRNTAGAPHNPATQFRPCHFFPLFYSQVLLSMGYQPRLVRISHAEERGYNGHGMTEVWSNQFRKWITMDPDLNIYYEKDGIPLNLVEVHNERYSKEPLAVKIVPGVHTSADFDLSKIPDIKEMIRYHSYVQIVDMRNDWMTNHYFRGHPKRSDRASLFWVDDKMPPVFNFSTKTSNVNDFYWTLNQTEIWVRKEGNMGSQASLAFKTFTPNFKHFEIIIDDAKKVISTEPLYVWDLNPGRNTLSVRSVNQSGVPGIQSWVVFEVRRAPHD